MRKFTVDFKTADIGTIGRKGEHNYPVLEFALDEDFQKCDFIIIEFGINGKKIPTDLIKPTGETLTFKLTKQLTKAGHHHVQLVGYVVDAETAEPQEIMKSPVVHFHIEQSVSGTEQEADSNPNLLDIIISKIHRLMELAHFHRNKEILDAITEDSLKPESSPEIPLVYALPENPKAGDACRLIRSEITAADGGRTVVFDYANLENLVKAGETHYDRVNYTISINADEYSAWLRISVDYSHDVIEITVEKFNSLYESFEGDFDQWCNIFYLNDNGEWEFSTEENNVGYNSSYHYNRKTDTITHLLEPLASVNIPNEYISSVTVEKDIDINIFDINIFHLEPIIMLYDGEWRAVANESLLYKQNGATISEHDIVEKNDSSKFFRLYLDWGKKFAPLTAKRWIDIPIEGTKEITEPGIGTQSTGIQLQLGGTGGGTNSWNDLTDKPTYEGTKTELFVNEGQDITTMLVPEAGMCFYKVCDKTFTYDDLFNVLFHIGMNTEVYCNEKPSTELTAPLSDNTVLMLLDGGHYPVLMVTKTGVDAVSFDGVEFSIDVPEVGIYYGQEIGNSLEENAFVEITYPCMNDIDEQVAQNAKALKSIHTHDNKDLLDSITESNLLNETQWNYICNIIPTKTSQLENDRKFVTSDITDELQTDITAIQNELAGVTAATDEILETIGGVE